MQRRLLEALAAGTRVATAVDVPPAAGPPSRAAGRPDPARGGGPGAHRRGRVQRRVAASLFVSEATVKTHVNHLLAKTAMRDRAQLVGYAFRQGLVTP